MEMMYTDEDLQLLIAETMRGHWTDKSVLRKQVWVSSPDNILCEYMSGNCGNQQDGCRNCLTYGLIQFIQDQDYEYLQNILRRIRERNSTKKNESNL